MLPLLQAMRPHQWIKNFFVLAALVFSKHLLDPEYLFRSGSAFVLFCLISSTVYLLNDILDRENDRQHPQKSSRPIASGRLKVGTAGVFAGLFALLACSFAYRLSPAFGGIVATYGILNVAYSIRLKRVVILDVMIIASGFLLRAIGGALAIDVEISSWFILCTMLLALFLGFVKRRQELVLLEENATSHRRTLEEYTLPFLDQIIAIVTAGALVSYALYTMSPEVEQRLGAQHMSLTIPFVVYGLMRYLFLVYTKNEGGNPATTILGDPPLIVTGVLWFLTLAIILYL